MVFYGLVSIVNTGIYDHCPLVHHKRQPFSFSSFGPPSLVVVRCVCSSFYLLRSMMKILEDEGLKFIVVCLI